MLISDFKFVVIQNKLLIQYMQYEFNLNYNPLLPTTLGNTCRDLIFVRNINVGIVPYVSYFCYHGPLINKSILHLYPTCLLTTQRQVHALNYCGWFQYITSNFVVHNLNTILSIGNFITHTVCVGTK